MTHRIGHRLIVDGRPATVIDWASARRRGERGYIVVRFDGGGDALVVHGSRRIGVDEDGTLVRPGPLPPSQDGMKRQDSCAGCGALTEVDDGYRCVVCAVAPACLACRRTAGGCATHRAMRQPSLEPVLAESLSAG